MPERAAVGRRPMLTSAGLLRSRDSVENVRNAYVAWKGWAGADFGHAGGEESIYFAREIRASGIESIAGLHVGELGYGNGGFAGWVRASGGRWVGRELIPELQARAVEAGLEVLPHDATFAAAWGEHSLDLLVGFDVVEHMELSAIRAFMQEARMALKPGGVVLLRMPSGDSPFSSAVYSGDLTHRTLLGSNAVRQLAREAGLEVRQIRPPVLTLSGSSPTRVVRRLTVRLAQSLAFGFIKHILMADDRAVLSPNMIVVLGSPRGRHGTPDVRTGTSC